MIRFEFIGTTVTRLGESPLWDARTQRLWWVDTVGCRIGGCRVDGSDLVEWTYDQAVGSIGLAEAGDLVAALADGFYLIDGETGAARPIARPSSIKLPIRFNDGKADRDGRFLSATMTEHDFESRNGTLWSLGTDGTATLLEQDFRLGNAICFSPTGDFLYFADSLEGVIRRYRYDRSNGAISAREDFLDTRPFGSSPDGATVDSQGRLWVALVQAQKIGCFSPNGDLVQLVDVPLPNPSCPAFGGPKLDILFLTGISDSGWKMRAEGPAAGRILAVHGLDATGIEESPYRSRPTN
ncbi:SMP-30/gluconolactonase/LRE family protein [Cupriavidus taiwanensis]|uniref:SMP-30/gluconolactonase/LRE family protein n=1 Tax=Cupriavidus taiwanensis TaxID=164546 RepID=UPI000E17CC8F|nr:SMP-30/gluconolactonase/LRE family protein [Cupriavidus taiwanensis]SOZ29611.1 Senescence marker protein-30 (SMP-30) [Cupriavidus taiwanensis]SPA34446.1 Senescence marker protein-30 (SMP-30) [Cupriavidus taiwanensis]